MPSPSAVALALLLATAGAGLDASAAASGEPEPPAVNAAADPAVRAGELFRDGEYAEAAAAFEQAYERTGDPAFLFGRAQALRRAGNCGAAIDVFEQFIATGPPEPDVRAARDVIAACRAILGEDAVEPIEPEPAPEPLPPDAVDEPPPPARRDVTGGVLMGVGAGVLVGGVALYGASFARAGARAETEQAYEQRRRSVRAMAATGVTLMITGGALLVGGAVRYAIVARRSGGRVARASLLADPLRWRF